MLRVRIWSDIVCPWCYVGQRRWQKAMAHFPLAQEVHVVRRAFELRKDQPRVPLHRLADLMVTNYGMQPSEIDEVFDRIRKLGAREGITLHPEKVRPVNSFDAHRLSQLAVDYGAGDIMLDTLFRAYHTDLRNIADHGVLRDLAAEVGLPDSEVASVLHGDRYAGDVRAQQDAARIAGVTSVPSFVIEGQQVLHGVVTAEEMLKMLNEEWTRNSGSDHEAPSKSAPGEPGAPPVSVH
ncbi:DsbA family oxidoreductase [Streptomyces smyrnaeus]|uniref:DsbA family oxidoreductase n=1 Tax=Streptomyces smyrnaeus TaxID=1387713 RepID=A0ABS3XX52_9ACTN|nr:DsbA family oxidoreductase [Streptomyces smyrnaeus]MBO8199983.1 DsbA family oxidoreductase [Streptomyces smyrnaeus]